MKRKEFEKFLRTEAFQCPQCRRKAVNFARPEKKEQVEVTSPVALVCITCGHIWNHTFHDYSRQAEDLRRERK